MAGESEAGHYKPFEMPDQTDYLIIRFNILYNTLHNSIKYHYIPITYSLLATISFNMFTKFLHLPMQLTFVPSPNKNQASLHPVSC